MSFETKVIYATDSHFTNPTTVAESGTPSSVTLQQLTPNQQYYTKAQIWNDGNMDDESSTEYFTTIPAGTITLTYIQTVRSGYGYDVSYRYTSTYAPSYATLSTNGSTFQGFIDSAQNVVSFWVTGLTSGEAYLTSVTLGDIYGETETVTGSIITTVVNEVHITGTEPSETSIDVDISYVLDGGFWQGYVDYWLASQDYETEPSQGHTYFNDGADTVTMSGLSPDTAYKFRVTITLSDMTTEIESNMVTASTLIDYSLKYFTIKNEYNGSNEISVRASYAAGSQKIYVSTDNGTTWTEKQTASFTPITLNAGESVIMKHTGSLISGAYYNKIVSTQPISAQGNIGSLVFGDDFRNSSLTTPYGAYSSLFNGCTTLISAENLVVPSNASISESCFRSAFANCTSLTKAPKTLPATTLAGVCYQSMFYGCTSLTTAPTLPATTLASECYAGMFSGCSSLTTAPVLQATTLAWACYREMFRGCSSLTSAPALPATTLEKNCYQSMFYGCTSLTSAPELRATTITEYCYNNMFYGCTSLTSAPTLPATTLASDCYAYMFYGCTSLRTAPVLPATTVTPRCYREMFRGCTSLTSAPALPATTVVGECYYGMFYGCTSLTTAPELPATTFDDTQSSGYYSNMFRSCRNLNNIKVGARSWSASNYSSQWVTDVSASGTFTKPSGTTIPQGVNGIPSGWTVVNV